MVEMVTGYLVEHWIKVTVWAVLVGAFALAALRHLNSKANLNEED